MNTQVIHPQLLADCHRLGNLTTGAVLLHRNAGLPWFILVPRTDCADLLDLAEDVRGKVLSDCASVSAFIKAELGFNKVNFAGLGNVVPQMHLHIVGRRQGDACWPQPVWGNLPAGEKYSADTLASWTDLLQVNFGLTKVSE